MASPADVAALLVRTRRRSLRILTLCRQEEMLPSQTGVNRTPSNKFLRRSLPVSPGPMAIGTSTELAMRANADTACTASRMPVRSWSPIVKGARGTRNDANPHRLRRAPRCRWETGITNRDHSFLRVLSSWRLSSSSALPRRAIHRPEARHCRLGTGASRSPASTPVSWHRLRPG